MSTTTIHRAWFGAGWCAGLTFDAILDGKRSFFVLSFIALSVAQFWIAQHVSKAKAQ